MDSLKKIAWSRGFLRLWFALSAVWIVGVLGYSVYAAYENVDKSTSASPLQLAARRILVDYQCDQEMQKLDHCASEELRNQAVTAAAEKVRESYSSVWNILTRETAVRRDMLSMLSAPFFVLIIGAVALFGIKISIMLGAWILRGFRAAG